MAIKRQTYNTACKDGCDVGDEPLRRVEPPDCDAVVSFETEEEKGLCHAGDVPQVLVVAPVLQFSVPPDRHGDAVTSVLNNSCKIILIESERGLINGANPAQSIGSNTQHF